MTKRRATKKIGNLLPPLALPTPHPLTLAPRPSRHRHQACRRKIARQIRAQIEAFLHA